jgi:hypothetical protein
MQKQKEKKETVHMLKIQRSYFLYGKSLDEVEKLAYEYHVKQR